MRTVTSTSWDITPERLPEHLAKGCRERHFFPHRIYYLPRCGSDGLTLAQGICGVRSPGRLWELLLFALPPVLDRFPEDLFFDKDVVWHQRHLGKVGLVAQASLVIRGRTLCGTNFISDLVQRISRRPECRSQVVNRFRGWNLQLMRGLIHFAVRRGLPEVHSPTSELVLTHTDPARNVDPELFQKIYDHTLTRWFDVKRRGDWWVLDVEANRDRILTPVRRQEETESGRTICLCHDIERSLGQTFENPELAASADREADEHLTEMLAVEAEHEAKATYHVVGRLLPEIRSRVESGAHALAFHSYDHQIDPWWPASRLVRRGAARMRHILVNRPVSPIVDQLSGCRQVDYRIRGYRPPQSRITPELSVRNLCWHNFEWLASSVHSLRLDSPTLVRGLVKIPILRDDYPLHTREMSYDRWEAQLLGLVREREFVALSLHDCYGKHWLPHYPSLIGKLQRLGRFATLDEVADGVFLSHSV